MPESPSVALVLDGPATPRPRPTTPGCFEAEFGQRFLACTYPAEVSRGSIPTFQHDPWACPPGRWLGELDRHLFAKATTTTSGGVLVAHPCERSGVPGVQFALWAPNARSVALLGDFKQLVMAGHHPMQQRLGGIWELFHFPAWRWDRYKYEVRQARGACYQKADPYWFSA